MLEKKKKSAGNIEPTFLLQLLTLSHKRPSINVGLEVNWNKLIFCWDLMRQSNSVLGPEQTKTHLLII